MFTIGENEYLLITDYFSKVPIAKIINKPVTSQAVVRTVKEIFGLFGVPECVMSDNGPQFAGHPFKELMAQCGIQHNTSSPRFPQSNGLIENFVGTVKMTLIKCQEMKQDLDFALLNLRTTPIGPQQPSPSEILFGRMLNNTIPSHYQPANQDNVKMYLEHKRCQQKMYYDNHARKSPLPGLYPGQQVSFQDNGIWRPARIENQVGERSYTLMTPQNRTIRRNRRDIRDSSSQDVETTGGAIHVNPNTVELAETIVPSTTTPTSGYTRTSPSTPSPARAPTSTRSGRSIKPPTYLEDFCT